VQFGLITDKRLCEEPQRIIDRFEPEFEKLVLALCMLPWDGTVDGDEAESWIFPRVAGPPRRSKRRNRVARRPAPRSKASEAEETAPSPTPGPEAAPINLARGATARPAGVRRRKSAFAAARGGGAE
jgi:hypothetical protein